MAWLSDYEPACGAVIAGMISRARAARSCADRPMDTDDIDPDTGEAWGVDPADSGEQS
jgi:hypothetical protein